MNAILGLVNHPLAHRVGWALLHSLWQGALVAALFGLLRLALRRRSANTRYGLAFGMLAIVAAAPLVTLLDSGGRISPPSPPAGIGNRLDVGALADSAAQVSVPAGNRWLLNWQSTELLDRILPWLVGAWALGVLVFAGRWLQGYGWVRRVKRVHIEPVEAEWLERLEDLKCRMNVWRPVRLLKSALVEVPMVVGWLRPVILLPVSALAGLTPAQLEAILAHELAHIRRHDHLVNAFQNVVETLMFYHPVVWWISRCIREEREQCCDEVVVRVCEDRLVYARALVTLEELRGTHTQMAFAASGGSLLRRIRRLLGTLPEERPASARELGGLALMGLGCALVIAGVCLMLGTTIYLATARIKLEHGSVELIFKDSKVTLMDGDLYFFQSALAEIRSPAVLNPVIDSLQLTQAWGRRYKGGEKLSPAEALALLQKRLDVRQVRDTDLAEIRVSDEDPAEEAAIANAIAKGYQHDFLEPRRRLSDQGVAALQEYQEQQDRRISEARRKVDELRANLKIADPVSFSGSEPAGQNAPAMLFGPETLRRFEILRIESQAEYVRQKTLLEAFQGLKPDQVAQAISGAGVQDALLSSLQEQLNMGEQKLVSLRRIYGPEYSEVVSVGSQVEDLKTKINDRVKGFLQGVQTRVDSLKASLASLSNSVASAIENDAQRANESRPYWEAKRNLEDLVRFRQMLDVKLSSERIETQLPKGNAVEIVEQAVAPTRPISPNRPQASGLLGSGLLLGLLGILLVKAGRRTIALPATC
ncbi:MAG TPA: M56 family metallopeptidase [Candidatus Binatia bacterium]|jgi:beta-lactamase regulating signal transducer with metallopeptidase domain/uncharacterized protein involved in exopolysaccharide biosynthesis|nr:M56 family metallopeptidase [Candidatus Binatia bacterium]